MSNNLIANFSPYSIGNEWGGFIDIENYTYIVELDIEKGKKKRKSNYLTTGNLDEKEKDNMIDEIIDDFESKVKNIADMIVKSSITTVVTVSIITYVSLVIVL